MDWVVSPHGPLVQLADNLWRVAGSVAGAPLERVMTVARRADGDIVIHSAVALDEPAMRQLEGLGPLAFLLVPNGFHRLDAPRYKARYPTLAVYCPRGSRSRVAAKVAVDGVYEELPADDAVRVEYLDGMSDGEGVMWVRSADGLSLVLNDLVFDMPHGRGLPGFVVRHLLGSSGGPRVSRLGKLMLVKDKAKLRASIERLASTPELRRVIVSHHRLIDQAPGEVLRGVAAGL